MQDERQSIKISKAAHMQIVKRAAKIYEMTGKQPSLIEVASSMIIAEGKRTEGDKETA